MTSKKFKQILKGVDIEPLEILIQNKRHGFLWWLKLIAQILITLANLLLNENNNEDGNI